MIFRTTLLAAVALASAASSQPAPAPPAAVPVLQAQELKRFKAAEAGQGAAADARHFYAVVNSRIGKYDKRTGEKVGEWVGDRNIIRHINDCRLIASELVCSNSNFPEIPMASSIEVFDPGTMTHKRSLSLGMGYGSLTWLDRKDGFWWAAFANYDESGGEPGRGSRFTQVVKFDDRFQRLEAWIFPDGVLEAFKPTSSSGGGWGPDGLLYVSGHDRPELYVMRLPKMGPKLEHVATIKVAFAGQAFDFDESDPGVIWSINRPTREVVVTRLPKVTAP
jgi:hypothetical protein